ncbi:zinc metalloprotease HtpX [Candidatus Manganitrophus noduliformans]|uniref:Protease HtpX homolog n=1 Tax=Candidatus Manganitrophus noduliformans TaxID=2606439 RepID=A0A7X6DNQ3_9BACT|nr:zinc metalloprotease HtpX [Candidatus Manganitrophus noduliformans]NKE70544.1 zinc metalloprotease HtpX [Candidatus Manganitrophus noduliformans]
MNALKTTFFLTLLTVLLVFAGKALGGNQGMILAFGFALVMNGISYWFSDKIVLKMYRAQPVTEADAPQLYNIVADLAMRAKMPMPKVYLIDNPTPNAFATGRNPEHAAVAVTTGIMRILNREELTGVLAHELSHVRHRDILISTVAATVAGAISMLANMAQWAMIFGGFGGRSGDREGGMSGLGAIVMIILAPIAAMMIQMAVSRSREFEADAGGAKLCGNPLWLAEALRKLHVGVQRVPMDANPATAHMFIVSPLRGGGMMSLFSTHPPMEERIARLEAMVYGRR